MNRCVGVDLLPTECLLYAVHETVATSLWVHAHLPDSSSTCRLPLAPADCMLGIHVPMLRYSDDASSSALQAAVIVFLASAGAGFITGANILVDGGFSLMLDAIPTFP